MSIKSCIKRDNMKVFRRLYMKRRQAGGEYEATWQTVPSKYVLKYGSIETKVDDVIPNFYDISGLDFELDNSTGYFSDQNQTKSFFYGYMTRHKTLIKLEAGYIDTDDTEYPTVPTQFIGLVSEDIPYKEDSKIKFKTNHLSSIFDDFPADRIGGLSGSLTASEVIEKIRDHTDGSAVAIFQKYVSSGGWDIDTTTSYYNVSTNTTLQDVTAWELIQQLAEAENYVAYIDRTGDFKFVERVAGSTLAWHFSGISDTNGEYGHNILKNISVDENIRKVYNRVKVKFADDDTTTSYYIKNETWDWGDSSSSFIYGIREYDYENFWLVDTSAAQTVAGRIYDEFVTPKSEIKLRSKFVPQLGMNDYVDVTYKTKIYYGGALWNHLVVGTSLWGRRSGFNINLQEHAGRIISLKHSIDNFYTDVTMRSEE